MPGYEQDKDPGARNQVKSLEKALSLLEVMIIEGRDLTVTEISGKVGLGKGTVHRILNTLKARKFIQQDPASRKYGFGVRAFNLGAGGRRGDILRKLMSSYLRELGWRCKETVSAAVLDFNQIRYIFRHESEELLRVAIQEGTRLPAHCCSTGKILLADLPEDELRRMFGLKRQIKKCTEHSLGSLAELAAALEEVRREGLAYDFEEALVGVRCLAAPVYDSAGRVAAAVSISGPKDRMKPENMAEYKGMLLETTGRISLELGYKPSSENAG